LSHELALASIKESYSRVVYSHKTQEKAVERLNGQSRLVKWGNLVLLVLTFSGVLNAVFAGGPTRSFLTVVISALALGLAIYRLSFNPEQEILEHRKTTNRLWRLREEFANLIGDIKDEVLPDEEIRRRRDDLTAQLTQVYADAPPTTPKDYARARAALGIGEEMTFSKEEIDRLLPTELRNTSTQP
jgi:hypothetical protein